MGNDLEIEIRAGATPGTYDVEVDSPAGTATGSMQLDAAAILGRRRELAASVLASAVTSRSTFSTLERPVRDVGHGLFEALFKDRVYGRYTASLQQAGSKGEPLRVVLRIRDPELAGIPWETLYDPESGEYLCQREPVVRYVEAAQPSAPLTATGPLRILCMVAAPSDLPTLDTDEERRRLDDALGELVEQGLVEVVWVEAGNWSALQQKLVSGPWHVLHVIAHGGVGPRGGVLALENEQSGISAPVSAQRFARLLHACRPVPRLVVLNSCSSGESAADDLLSSTAAALVHSGISAAVAMQFAVTDPAALAFSRGFYQALSQNIAVDESVRLGRIAIDGTSEQTLEWVTPVIYLRTDDTRLFELTSAGPPPPSVPAREQEISHEAAKYGLYVQALAAVRKERYDEAAALLDSLITLDPSYRDAAQLRDRVRRDQRVGTSFDQAVAAEQAGDLETARRGFRSVIDADPAHLEAKTRHDAVERRLSIASLTDEMHVHAHDEDWEAVLAVSAELAQLDPAAADPDGLATRARQETAPVEQIPEPEPEPEPVVRDLTPEPPTQPAEPPPRPPEPPVTRETPVIHEDPPPRPGRSWKKVAALAVPAVLLLGGVGWWVVANNQEPVGGDVTCWNGDTAGSASECELPTGQDGLATVFASMGSECESQTPNLEAKEELFQCDYGTYVIRYSRWDSDYDKFAYFDKAITGASTDDWMIGDEAVGRTWTGLDDREAEELKYRAIAAYSDWPYDVTVKGVDEAALQEGANRIQAKKPSEIGLP